jgi:hypothetical protein
MDVKNLFTCGPGPQINLIPGAGHNFLIYIRYAHARFEWYAVCHLVKIRLAAAMGSVNPPTFLALVCSPTGEAGKNVQTCFFSVDLGLPQAFNRDMWSATIG